MSEDGYCCTPDSGDCCGPGSWCCARAGKHDHLGDLPKESTAYSREHFRALVEATPAQESQGAKILTASCRFTGLDHADCAGHIYLGSIFGDPSNCECDCHDAD